MCCVISGTEIIVSYLISYSQIINDIMLDVKKSYYFFVFIKHLLSSLLSL